MQALAFSDELDQLKLRLLPLRHIEALLIAKLVPFWVTLPLQVSAPPTVALPEVARDVHVRPCRPVEPDTVSVPPAEALPEAAIDVQVTACSPLDPETVRPPDRAVDVQARAPALLSVVCPYTMLEPLVVHCEPM